MRTRSIMRTLATAAVLSGLCSLASANVWMDETFENGPFTQGNGVAGGVPSAELDTYSSNALANPVTSSPLTHTGTVFAGSGWEGTKSYQLTPGQTLSVGPTYQDPANGNLQIYQYAIKVSPIPAAGTVGEFRWNHDYDNTSATAGLNSFFVRLVSTGSAINIIGGEDVAHVTATTASLGTLSGPTSWGYITLLLNKDTTTTLDNRANVAAAYPSGVPPGMHFFKSSNTSGLNIAMLNGTPGTYTAGTWAFTVTSGTVYLDDIYWDGGLENDVSGNQKVRPFNKAPVSRVDDWPLMN